jgi:hypothetical protein
MYEHDEPSEGFLVVDISSREEGAFPNNSCDEEITRRLFNDLNHGLLGPPNNDNIIVLSDSNEEEQLCHLLLGTPGLQPPPPPMVMTHPTGCKMIVMVVAPPIGGKVVVVTVEIKPVRLRLPHQKGCL